LNIERNKMKNKNAPLSGQIQSENCTKSGKNVTLNTYIHDRSLSWLGRDTSIKSYWY